LTGEDEAMKVQNMLTSAPRLNSTIQLPSVADRMKETSTSFEEVLKDSIASVNDLQAQAGRAVDKLVAGETTDLHEVMIAVEKARTSFDLLMEVRNKAVDTYRELMRMQV
jgi:flagellar hook-basal body complex protein FliE